MRFIFQSVILIWSLSVFSVHAAPDRLSVVTSIRPLALLAKDLLGEWAAVDSVVPPNADPHNLSLKVSSRIKLDKADLVFWLGPEFERFLRGPMGQRSRAADLAAVDIEGLFDAAIEGDKHAPHNHSHHDSGSTDLHVWLDPGRAELMLMALSDRFVTLAPELKSQVEFRLEVLLREIRQESIALEKRLRPFAGRGYAVYHDAYSYFSGAFGLNKVEAVNQLPEQRLSAKHIYRLQQAMKGASCIVVERVSAKTERLAKVLKVRSVSVDPLAADLSIQSYVGYLRYLGDGFERCFTP